MAARKRTNQQTQPPPVGSPKDPQLAMLIELAGGLFGLLGIGRLYAGRYVEGGAFLITWLIIGVFFRDIALSIFLGSTRTGVGVLFVSAIVNLCVAFFSGRILMQTLQQEQSRLPAPPVSLPTVPATPARVRQVETQQCQTCGTNVPVMMMFCSKCGSPMPARAAVVPGQRAELASEVEVIVPSVAEPARPQRQPASLRVQRDTPQPVYVTASREPAPSLPLPLASDTANMSNYGLVMPPPPQFEYTTLLEYEKSRSGSNDVVGQWTVASEQSESAVQERASK